MRAVGRKKPAENDRLRRFKAVQSGRAGFFVFGHRIPDTGIGDFFNRRGKIADFTGGQRVHRVALRAKHADLIDRMGRAGRHHANFHAFFQRAVNHPHQHHHAQIRVIPAIDQHRFQRRFHIAFGRRQLRHNRFQHIANAEAGFGGNIDTVFRIQPDNVFNLGFDALRLGGRQIDLVQHRHNLMVHINRLIDIGQGLRLNPLAGINHQKRAFASRQRAVYFIGKIDMARRINQVQLISLAILRLIIQPHGLRLNGDAAFALNIHIIQHLLRHFALAQTAGHLNQAVGQSRFAVVNMGNDGEITNMVFTGRAHAKRYSTRSRPRQCGIWGCIS